MCPVLRSQTVILSIKCLKKNLNCFKDLYLSDVVSDSPDVFCALWLDKYDAFNSTKINISLQLICPPVSCARVPRYYTGNEYPSGAPVFTPLGHCIVCPSLIYGVWLPIYYLLTLLSLPCYHSDVVHMSTLLSLWRSTHVYTVITLT